MNIYYHKICQLIYQLDLYITYYTYNSDGLPENWRLVGVGRQKGIFVLHLPSSQNKDALPSLAYRRPGGPSHRKKTLVPSGNRVLSVSCKLEKSCEVFRNST